MSDKSLQDDVNRVVRRKGITKRDPIVRANRVSTPAVVGVGSASEEGSGSGSGIDSPLTETSRTTQPIVLKDSTGVLSVTFDVASQVTMKDKSGREVVFVYAAE